MTFEEVVVVHTCATPLCRPMPESECIMTKTYLWLQHISRPVSSNCWFLWLGLVQSSAAFSKPPWCMTRWPQCWGLGPCSPEFCPWWLTVLKYLFKLVVSCVQSTISAVILVEWARWSMKHGQQESEPLLQLFFPIILVERKKSKSDWLLPSHKQERMFMSSIYVLIIFYHKLRREITFHN